MSEALGDFVFVSPRNLDGTTWTGRVVSRGAKVIKYSTYYECDLVTYTDANIERTTSYNGDTVHIVSFENITKIEGVY
jgi:hypothetical protein